MNDENFLDCVSLNDFIHYTTSIIISRIFLLFSIIIKGIKTSDRMRIEYVLDKALVFLNANIHSTNIVKFTQLKH